MTGVRDSARVLTLLTLAVLAVQCTRRPAKGNCPKCPAGSVCVDGKCHPVCSNDAQCPSASRCQDGVCALVLNPSCTSNKQCRTPATSCDETEGLCLAGACFYAHQAGRTPCALPDGSNGVCLEGVCLVPDTFPCDANDVCAPDVCIAGFCHAPAGFRGPCDKDSPDQDCAASLACVQGSCLWTTGLPCMANVDCAGTCIGLVCQPLSAITEPCDQGDSGDCATGAVCGGLSLCEAAIPCFENGACTAPLSCVTGFCRTPSTTGGRCDRPSDHADCAANHVCQDGLCLLILYQPCTYDAGCLSGGCDLDPNTGVRDCRTLYGAACASTPECARGWLCLGAPLVCSACPDNPTCDATYPGFVCRFAAVDSVAPSCLPRGDVGAPCDLADGAADCASALNCDAATSTCRRIDGEPCVAVEECFIGSTCEFDATLHPSTRLCCGAAKTCCQGDAFDSQCPAGSHCDANECVANLTDGQTTCNENSDCASGNCDLVSVTHPETGRCCASGFACCDSDTGDCAAGWACRASMFECVSGNLNAACDDNLDCHLGLSCTGNLCTCDVTPVNGRGTTCGGTTAIDVGTFPDDASRGVVTVTGTIPPSSNSVLYRFYASDLSPTSEAGGDNFHVRVNFALAGGNPNAEFVFDVFQTDCNTTLGTGLTRFDWYTDFLSGGGGAGTVGERPCTANPGTTGANTLGYTTAIDYCADNSRTFLVRVQHVGAYTRCVGYTLEISNQYRAGALAPQD